MTTLGRPAVRVSRLVLVLAAAASGLALAQGQAAGAAGSTSRINLSSSGVEPTQDSTDSTISADGRFVAFVSNGKELGMNSTLWWQVWLRDRQTGQTTLVSQNRAGYKGDRNSIGRPTISADGRYVAFTSYARNLLGAGVDTNSRRDVFIRDLWAVPPSIRRVSVSTITGRQANNGSSEASISADGRYVAFSSGASNLVPGDTNGHPDVFVRDLQAGTTTRVSVSSSGAQTSGTYDTSAVPAISADGRYVAFLALTNDLVPGDSSSLWDAYVRDLQTNTTSRVSVSSTGAQQVGELGANAVSISADGRYVAFASNATNLVPGDTNGATDVFVRDRQAGTTTRVSVSSNGAQATGGPSAAPWISADGRYVAFDSFAANLVAGDTNDTPDVFVRDRQNAATTRVSVASAGGQGDSGSWEASISSDGQSVAFQSTATNLVPGDTNGRIDIFVHDRG